MNFCCDRFMSHFAVNAYDKDGKVLVERFPSIKIVKPESTSGEKIIKPYRYLFVCGPINEKSPFINMAYRPFCGTSLFKFYADDNYLHEQSVHFF